MIKVQGIQVVLNADGSVNVEATAKMFDAEFVKSWGPARQKWFEAVAAELKVHEQWGPTLAQAVQAFWDTHGTTAERFPKQTVIDLSVNILVQRGRVTALQVQEVKGYMSAFIDKHTALLGSPGAENAWMIKDAEKGRTSGLYRNTKSAPVPTESAPAEAAPEGAPEGESADASDIKA